jgi:hypothetical protein
MEVFMQIKSMEVKGMNAGNVGWIEQHFKFTTGQKARFHTHTHTIKCFNGIGRDITETSIGEQMIIAIKNYMDEKQ